MVLTRGRPLHPGSRWEESRAWNLSRVRLEMGTLRMGQALQPPSGKGGEHQLLEGNSQEANGDGGVRTARTTDLLFSQYLFFFFFLTVLFLLTIFSLKVTTGCKILSFRKLMCGEVTRHFSSNFSDIFLLSVNQYPLVSLGHVINCIAEHILEQTASFKSLSFSLSVSAFSVNICLYVKTPVDPWGAPTVKNLSFVQCLGLC